MFDLDFDSEELQFPVHPRYQNEKNRILNFFRDQGLKSHFLILSSGTTSSELKGYALSKKALFLNAKAVNEHFNLSSDDVWGLSLPHYHVGGLSVLIRAGLLKSKLINLGVWNPAEWHHQLSTNGITITTVVPTQVFDLVSLNLQAPSSLRFLIVGGDFLSHDLEKKALGLGWPIIRTFGMTEVCSQLLSANQVGGDLRLLPIHNIKTDEDCRLWVKSESLFTCQFKLKENIEVKLAKDFCDQEGFYPTQDMVRIEDSKVTHLGRLDDQLKINGKLFSLNEFKETLHSFALKHQIFGKVELVIEEDDRQGKKLVVCHLPGIFKIPDDLLPVKFDTKEVSSFSRTDLGKLIRR